MSDRVELNRLRREHEQQQSFRNRLIWAHGPARAAAILAGTDKQTNTDIENWRALGQ